MRSCRITSSCWRSERVNYKPGGRGKWRSTSIHPAFDAAHIVPDREERGFAEIPNGLALCRIHHAAFDANILGVDADRKVHIRTDVLAESDGPMMKHGLQEMHGRLIVVPRDKQMHPKRDYLEERFERFKVA